MGNFNTFVYPKPNPPLYDSTLENLIYIQRESISHSSNFLATRGIFQNGDTSIEKIPCLYICSPNLSDKIVLYFHGNSTDLGKSKSFCERLAKDWNVNFLLVEYPSYGIYKRVELSETNILEDSITVYDFLITKKGIKPDQIIVFGRSIGSGPAVYLASARKIAGLILFSPFLSLRKVVENKVGSFMASMITEQFNNENKIGRVGCPILFLHGKQDDIVPYSHSV